MGSSAAPLPGNKTIWCHIILNEVEGHCLKGSIPMVLPAGKYKFPDVAQVKSQDGTWIQEWIKESGLESHGETAEDRDRFASEMAVFCAYLIPGLQCGCDAMKFYMWIMTLGFLADDVLEGRDVFGRDREAGMEMATIAGDLFTGKYSTFEAIPFSEEAFGLKTMIRAGFVAAQKAQAHIPNFFECASYFAEATTLSYSATLTMELEDHYEDDLGHLPLESYHDFRFYEGGFQGFIELALLCHSAVPTTAMRHNVLFKRIIELAWHICVNVNDLFGVRRELDAGRGYNCVIYRSRETDLPQAFAQVIKLVEKDVLNFCALTTRYRAHCPNDTHGHHVLTVLEQFIDGHIYSFTTNTRYGNVQIEFIQR